VEREQTNLVRRLEMDQVDLAIMVTNGLSPDEYDWVPLVRDEIVVVCSNRHPLARSRRVAIGDLKDERFVLLDPASANYTIVTQHCREAGFFPNISFMHTRHRPLLSAVKRDIGITLLARALTHTKDESSLSCVPLNDPFFMEVGLVCRKGRQLTPWANALMKFFACMYAMPIGDVSAQDSE